MRKSYAIRQTIDEAQAKRIVTKIAAAGLGNDDDVNRVAVLLAESIARLRSKPQVKATLEIHIKTLEQPQFTGFRSFLQKIKDKLEKLNNNEQNAASNSSIGITD